MAKYRQKIKQGPNLFRWLSGNRQGYVGDGLIYILLVGKLLGVAPYARLAVQGTIEAIVDNERSIWKRMATSVALVFVVVPLRIFFEFALLIARLISLLGCVVENAIGAIVTVLTVGLPLAYEQRWAYEVLMSLLEGVLGSLWQRSVIELGVNDIKCVHQGGCKKDVCFEVHRSLTRTQMIVKCDCMSTSVMRQLSVTSQTLCPELVFASGKRFIEQTWRWNKSVLDSMSTDGCCHLSGELHTPRYDPSRLMWIETRVGRAHGEELDSMTYTRERSNLDETLRIVVTECDLREAQDLGLEQLLYVDLFARGGLQSAYCISIVAVKFLANAAVVATAVAAVVRETEAGKIAATVILLVFVSHITESIKSTYSRSELGLSSPRKERTMAIELASSGRVSDLVSKDGACWAVSGTDGDMEVGPLSWIENALINRTVCSVERGFSLSRRGTRPLISDIKVVGNLAHADGWESMLISAEESFKALGGKFARLDLGRSHPVQ